ncbi:MAG: hypothetical protein LLF76_05865 [Planctomycetaceae bacterium]|nr:hypothetical protein [Planctomycetaceae bacterium]
MKNLSKRLILHCSLTIGVFVGLGMIAVPGPHGGLAMLMPYIIGLLNPSRSDLLSFLLIYPPILLLAASGFIRKDIYRIVCSHVSVLVLVVFFCSFIQNVDPPVRYIAFITGGLFFASAILSFILPVFLQRTLVYSKKLIVGESLASLVLIALSASATTFQWLPEKKVPLKIHSCETNLQLIGQLVELYVISHQDYPSCPEWSDAMAETGSYIEQTFMRCPLASQGKCHYAMNQHVTKDSPADTVLIFESNSGWNLYGGIDMANTTRHSGCYVLFNDKHVEFASPDELQKLNWGGDPNQP